MPGYKNRGFWVYESREEAEDSLARQKPGVFTREETGFGEDVPYHWEIHETELTQEQFADMRQYDSDTITYHYSSPLKKA